MNHFVEKCEVCGKVMSQCRCQYGCMSCDKEDRWSTCEACDGIAKSGITEADRQLLRQNFRDQTGNVLPEDLPTSTLELWEYIKWLETQIVMTAMDEGRI